MEEVKQSVRRIAIVGPASLQNKLLARLIEQRTAYPCEIRAASRVNGTALSAMLVLVDAADLAASLPEVVGRCGNLAVINADDRLQFDALISLPGVKGIFFCDTTEDNLVRGIEAIFSGEYWLPRRALIAHLERTRVARRPASQEAAVLTPKETDTLRLLARGDSTERIARELKVSPHTVKTHIYNLFRKIKVNNRVQAVHWASRNMVIPALGDE